MIESAENVEGRFLLIEDILQALMAKPRATRRLWRQIYLFIYKPHSEKGK